MSISSTRRISSATSVASKVENKFLAADNHSQFVENIDTTNNVLVRDDTNSDSNHHQQSSSKQQKQPDFTSPAADISTSLEALALSGIFEDDSANQAETNPNKVNIYNNNQSIIKDEEVERTGRNYLKHFYEKNEHFEDIDELI